MKKLLVVLVLLTIALLEAQSVLAQAGPDTAYPVDPNVCCYDVNDASECDWYYEMYPDELCDDCPDRCAEPEPEPLIMRWFRRMIRLFERY